jgi:formylglycine-generating enzyme required for sulfatase activity/predicted Ser/Thr protein kinase
LPARFGRYRVKKKLGGGGMGSVYLVENTELEREEALKVPHFDEGDDPQLRERFLREAKSAAKLDHPNLCPVYDAGALEGVYYLTMPFLRGKPLSGFVGKPQPADKAVEVVNKLARALAAAHAKGVIHRDLKPANVMMVAGVGPVVMDFGLAKNVDADKKLTSAGSMLGTPAYMPPEQVRGELDQMGPASDVYSLCVILYELLTGRLPFEGTTAMIFGQILYAEPPPPSKLVPGLNPVLNGICQKALAKEPAARYPSMDAFAAALSGFSGATPTSEGADIPTPREAKASEIARQPKSARTRIEKADTNGARARSTSQLDFARKPGVRLALAGASLGILGCILVFALLSRRSPVPTGDTEGVQSQPNQATKSATEDQHRLKPVPADTPKRVTNGVGMTLTLIPAGEFQMGSSKSEDTRAADSELPRHRVRITRPFYMGVTEVTQGQYRAVTGVNPSFNTGSDNLPVDQVSWLDALAFCNKLSARENLEPYYRIEGKTATIAGGPGYRLPTEAEWEYACRAGTTTRYWFGNDESLLPEYAWIGGKSNSRSHPVAEKPANAFGLYDMHGNAFEWCWDGFDANFYRRSPVDDPAGPKLAPPIRVHRGGGWSHPPEDARSAGRAGAPQDFRNLALGFRVARDP